MAHIRIPLKRSGQRYYTVVDFGVKGRYNRDGLRIKKPPQAEERRIAETFHDNLFLPAMSPFVLWLR